LKGKVINSWERSRPRVAERKEEGGRRATGGGVWKIRPLQVLNLYIKGYPGEGDDDGRSTDKLL
jgi:hypothetical protein